MIIEKMVRKGMIRLTKDDVRKIKEEGDEIVLFSPSPERVMLVNARLWKKAMREFLAEAETEKEKNRRARAYFSQIDTINAKNLKPGRIALPSQRKGGDGA